MGPIQVVVEDGNNLVLEVTPTPDTTVILDRGIAGPVGPQGPGDVDGPASSTDNAVARFDGTTGKLIQNSLVTVSDTGAVAGVTTLAASGAVTLSGLTASTALALDASKNVVSVTNTGTGNNVLSNSPTLVTPALGTPASGVVTNLTGTASININGTVGATTANTGAFTTLTTSSTVTLNGGTANGVAFLDASKVLTTGSALTFDGTWLGVTGGFRSFNSVAGGPVDSIYTGTTAGAVLGQFRAYGTGSGVTAESTFRTVLDGGSITSANFQWLLNNSEQMRLTSTGLGIGTSSPATILNVSRDSGLATGTGTTVALRIGDTSSDGGAGTWNTTQQFSAVQFFSADTSGVGAAVRASIGTTMESASAGSSALTFFTNAGTNTEKMRLTSSGNLGIGTSTAPGSNGGGLAIYRSDFPRLTFRNSTTGDATMAGTQFVAAGLNFEIYNKQSGYIDFGTGNLSRMLLDSSGNLGLGVTPSAWTSNQWSVFEGAYGGALAFYKASNVPVTVLTSNAYNDGSWKYKTTDPALQYEMDGNVGIHKWYTAPSGTAGNAISFTQAMTLDASGNLGVGTTTPDILGRGYGTTLGVSNTGVSGTSIAINSGTSAYPALELGRGGSRKAFFTAQSTLTEFGNLEAVPLVFLTNSTERARITSGGDLLVGTTSSTGAAGASHRIGIVFDTASAWALATKTNNRGWVNHQTNSTGGIAAYFEVGASNTNVGAINTNATTTSYVTSSDYRLKNTIAPMTGALAKVALLKPCTYKWNADGSDGEGFIAHELAEVVPQCVTGEKDAVDSEGKPQYQGIDTSFLVATLTAAIQEQQAIINSLKARLDAANI